MRSMADPLHEFVEKVVADLSAEISECSTRIGKRVIVHRNVCTERAELLSLPPPGAISANRCCRLIETGDGWIAANMPREADLEAVPAWTGCALDADPWKAIVDCARSFSAREFAASAQILSLAVAEVGSVRSTDYAPVSWRMGEPRAEPRSGLRVLDVSDLWAGPLCGVFFAAAGCDVLKINTQRALRSSPLAFDKRLNGGKKQLSLDLRHPPDLAALKRELRACDVVITSARPRAFDQLGLSPSAIFAEHPSLIWIAITGYGWQAPNAMRVGFGDDAAAAGGLVNWKLDKHPVFVGDALADPLTGLVAALAGFQAIVEGGGVLIDAALARTAAGVAHSAAFNSGPAQ